MRTLRYIFALSLWLPMAGCAGNPSPNATPTVKIENRSNSDMDIYVRPSLKRPVRLGFVPAADTVQFVLAPAIVAGSGGFNLEARPVRAGGSPLLSETFIARPGDEIYWSIPPQ